jgi:hypothetical protein
MVAIMIINPILYCSSTKDARFLISVRLGQYTEKERKAVDGIKTKFLFIILTFYICWLPNLICGVLIWSVWMHLPEIVIILLWYSMVSIYFDTFSSYLYVNSLVLSSCDSDDISLKQHAYISIMNSSQKFCIKISIVPAVASIRVVASDKQY